jgi:hypothetical protein
MSRVRIPSLAPIFFVGVSPSLVSFRIQLCARLGCWLSDLGLGSALGPCCVAAGGCSIRAAAVAEPAGSAARRSPAQWHPSQRAGRCEPKWLQLGHGLGFHGLGFTAATPWEHRGPGRLLSSRSGSSWIRRGWTVHLPTPRLGVWPNRQLTSQTMGGETAAVAPCKLASQGGGLRKNRTPVAGPSQAAMLTTRTGKIRKMAP